MQRSGSYSTGSDIAWRTREKSLRRVGDAGPYYRLPGRSAIAFDAIFVCKMM
jgi:hypothetical protein